MIRSIVLIVSSLLLGFILCFGLSIHTENPINPNLDFQLIFLFPRNFFGEFSDETKRFDLVFKSKDSEFLCRLNRFPLLINKDGDHVFFYLQARDQELVSKLASLAARHEVERPVILEALAEREICQYQEDEVSYDDP